MMGEEEVTPSNTGLRGGFDEEEKKSVTTEGKQDTEDEGGLFKEEDEFPVYGEWHPVSDEFP